MQNWQRTACFVAVLSAASVAASPAQMLTTVVNFNLTKGASPYSSLVQGTDGDFYGTTADAGWDGYGTVFKLNLVGTRTTLHRFCTQTPCSDGAFPCEGLKCGDRQD